MPVMINDLKTKGYYKVRINLEDAFDRDDPGQEECADQWAGAYVDLRELNAGESAVLQEKHDVETFGTIFKKVLVGHNIYRDENKMASNEEVVEMLQWSGTVYTYVMSEWTSSLPLAKRSAKGSEKLRKTLSEAAESQASTQDTQGDTSL